MPTPRRRLSARLLWLTMLAVMIAEVLIFVPSIANFRRQWLHQQLQIVAVAGLSAEQGAVGGGPLLDPRQQEKLLQVLRADLIAINTGGVTRLLARAQTIAPIDLEIHLEGEGPFTLIGGAFDTLILGGERTLRVLGPVGRGDMEVEVVMAERPLRQAMLTYSRNIFFLSLAIASFAACLVYLAINQLLIRPIRRMTNSMIRFRENPSDPERVIAPSRREDEIGVAEAELAGMQTALARTLREQRHLADLGLAVSKINHDLRNLLASAQLVSDRLSDLPDPHVQRFAPMLIRSLDRALTYTQSVLAYGRAVESTPVKRKLRLRRLVDDVFDLLGAASESGIRLINDVPERCEIDADPDQLYRALSNLCRNAVQALDSADNEAVVRELRVSAGQRAEAPADAWIRIEDSGPGLSPRAKEHLFKAFRGSTRAGGTGLGLAIAAEIVEAHGGRIQLVDSARPGACFEIRLPLRSERPELGPAGAGGSAAASVPVAAPAHAPTVDEAAGS